MSLTMVLEPETHTAAQGRRADRDLSLVEALRLREPTAAERLVATYGERAYRLAMGITGNKQDVEDVVQDACWSVVRKIDSFRGDSTFGSWFYRIVANGAYGKLRSRLGRPADISLDDVMPVFDEHGRHAVPVADWSSRVDNPALQSELREALTSSIAALPDLYRTVLVLRDVEGWSTVEIARGLGLSVPVVKTRVHRARLFLRKRLGNVLMADAPTAA
jgi:RNA polymerase sigma-70 factor (ECF subfamily)